MSATYDIKAVERWLNRPLCVRYVAGAFRAISIQVRGCAGAAPLRVHWGLGYLLDGECEVLGAWPTPDPALTLAPRVLEDLQVRGVLRMRTLTGNCLAGPFAEAAGDALSLIRCVQVVPVEADALAEAAEVRSLSGSVATLILDADRLAEEIQSRLVASISRRRPFADSAAAMTFVAAELHRADRKLWARPAPLQPLRLLAHDAAPAVYH